MADVNLPSFGELGQMEFMAPMAFQQAQDQIGLANQFQQQNLAAGEQDLQTKVLANLFAEQANPMKLQGLGLQNEAQANENVLGGIKARQGAALEPQALAAKRQELLAKASEDELKKLMSQAEKDYMSDDPVVSKRAENKLLHTKAELTRRNAAADALERAQTQAEARLQGIKMAQEGQNSRTAATNATRESIAARKEAAIQAKAAGNPKTAEAAAVKFQMESDMEEDPVEKARLAQLSKQYGAYSMALKNAQAGTKPDMAQFGFTTNPVNLGVGAVNPAPTRVQTDGSMRTEAAAAASARGPIGQDPQGLLRELAKAEQDLKTVPAQDRPNVVEYINSLKRDIQQSAGQPRSAAPTGPANAPVAPPGRVVIYKDGKAVGSIPAAQVEAAKKQGYSIK